MSNENLNKITNQQTMTSLDIAEITGRQHKNILQAIRSMEPAWEKTAGLKFQRSYYKDKSGKNSPMYQLTKTECLFVATKFNDEARAKLVLRWEQLEKEKLQANLQSTQPQHETVSNLPADPSQLTRKQLLLMALEAEEEKEQLQQQVDDLQHDNYALASDNAEKDMTIQHLQQQTAYLAVIMADSTAVTITQIAQDYGMGAVSFNKLLNGIGIQYRVGEQWILYSPYKGCGYVQTRMVPIHHAGRPDTLRPLTVWTQAGRKFIYERLKKHGTLPLVERHAMA